MCQHYTVFPYFFYLMMLHFIFFFFFFNDTATTEIYTLSLHDALPICRRATRTYRSRRRNHGQISDAWRPEGGRRDRKSTRLNSSHLVISYAVFCLKKKKKQIRNDHLNHTIDITRCVEHISVLEEARSR